MVSFVLSTFLVGNHVHADNLGETDLTDGLPITAFTSSGSLVYNGDPRRFGPEKAFDNVWDENNEGFQTAATNDSKWISVDFGKKQVISKLRYKADVSYNYRYDMKDFVVQASNDNLVWTDQYTGTALGNNLIQEFAWQPTDAYRYWKILLKNSIGNTDIIMVAEMELIGVDTPILAAPLNLTAVAGDKKVNLSWSPVADVTNYNVKRSLSSGGPYTTIASNVTDVSYIDNAVVNGTTYYYVITALNDNSESSNSNEASATPQKINVPEPEPSGDRAILTVTLTTGLEKEFDLSIEEVNAFLEWYDARDTGTGSAKYGINKHTNNKGPFSSRKEYVVFDKILTFSIDEYSAQN